MLWLCYYRDCVPLNVIHKAGIQKRSGISSLYQNGTPKVMNGPLTVCLRWLTKCCRGRLAKFNSRIEGFSERLSEGMETNPTVRGDSVEGHNTSWLIYVHSHPTGAWAE